MVVKSACVRETALIAARRELNPACISMANHYSCDEVRKYYAKSKNYDMQVRVDTANLGLVTVAIDQKWVTARPHTRDLEGISLAEWEEQCLALRTRFRHEAELSAEYRAHATKTIRDITSTARARLRRQQATPFGHSSAYVQHLQDTLFSGFRFREQTDPVFGEAPDGLGREILPAPDSAPQDEERTHPPVSGSEIDDESIWDSWPDQPEEDWRLEDGR